jgi:DNA-binding transcriptional LysR family regulator
MAITLRQIDAFRAVMLTGTATEAAQVLGITQPAVSRLIADLEQEIGFQLFDRIGRRVAPTAEAQILIEEVKRALMGLDQIKETAAEIGRFRYSLVVRLIKEFTALYPDTFVSLEVRASDAAVEWVVSQQCDLGIATPATKSPAFDTRPLVVGVSCCILPTGHRLAARDLIRAADLEGESFVSFRPDSLYRAQIDAIFQQAGVTRIMQYEARTTDVICSMVAAGLGVAIIGPFEAAGFEARLGGGFLVRRFEPTLKTELSLMWSTHRPIPAVARRFIEVMDRSLGKAD